MQEYVAFELEEQKELHKKYIDTINNYLPLDKKVYSDNIDTKFNNRINQVVIGIAEEMKARRKAQDAILTSLEQKNNYQLKKPNVISSLFLTSDSLEANEYNEELFKDYIKNPNKYLYEEIRKVLDIKSKDLYRLEDDPLDNAKFYKLNFSTVENASKIIEIIKNDDGISEELKDALPSMESLIKLAAYPKNLTKKFEANVVAFPNLDAKQAGILINENLNEKDFNPDILEYIKTQADPKNTFPPKKYLHEMFRKIRTSKKDRDIFENGDKFMTKLVAYKINDNNEKEIIDMDKFTFATAGRIELKKYFNTVSRIGVECITKEAKDRYVEIWKDKFASSIGKDEYDIDDIEFEHRGGFFERFRGTTSNQYKEMILALREFNDPESKNYLDYDNLKAKAKAYIAHKEAQGYGVNKPYSGTPKKRKDLADSILEMEKKHNQIMQEIKDEFSSSVRAPENEIAKQQIFESNDNVEVIAKQPIANNQDQKLEIEEIDDDSPNLDINEFMAQNK